MYNLRLPRLTIPGKPILTSFFDRICREIETSRKVSCTGQITATVSDSGVHLHVPRFPIGIVLTTSAFTARSGATPGTGTATFQLFNGTSFVADTELTNIQMFNYSSSSTPPASGKYGIAVKLFSVWWLVTTEC